MEKIVTGIERLAESAREYADAKIEYTKLAVAEKTALVAANTIAGFIVIMVLGLFATFLAIGIALLIGEWIGHMWAGFLIVAGICLLKAVIIWTARKRIIQLPVMNALIKQLFADEED